MGLSVKKGLAHREIDGAVYIVDAAGSRLHRLNDTASFIWEGVVAGLSVKKIAEGLAGEFEITEKEAAADADSFIRQMLGLGLLVGPG